eukprot:jgi/Mesvir1/24961/Mv16931-RA.1
MGLHDDAPKYAACGFAILAWIISCTHIYNHLRNYTEPMYQRYIVRIIFMVPVYAVTSFVSLIFESDAVLFDTIRECYEAWVIYNFLSLCFAYLGGPGAVTSSLDQKIIMPSWATGTCCFPVMTVNGKFLRQVKQGALLFVITKPICAAIALILDGVGHYEEGDFSPAGGYLYLTIIYNVTYTIALYALGLFYLATKEILAPYKPVYKFLVVKAVVFMTYWQGLVITLLMSFNMVNSHEDAREIQDFMLCVEMAIAAVLHTYAFPWREYSHSGTAAGLKKSIGHAFSMNDVVSDTFHNFAPVYRNYVLYSDDDRMVPKASVRVRTFVPLGKEMEDAREARQQNETSAVAMVGHKVVEAGQVVTGGVKGAGHLVTEAGHKVATGLKVTGKKMRKGIRKGVSLVAGRRGAAAAGAAGAGAAAGAASSSNSTAEGELPAVDEGVEVAVYGPNGEIIEGEGEGEHEVEDEDELHEVPLGEDGVGRSDDPEAAGGNPFATRENPLYEEGGEIEKAPRSRNPFEDPDEEDEEDAVEEITVAPPEPLPPRPAAAAGAHTEAILSAIKGIPLPPAPAARTSFTASTPTALNTAVLRVASGPTTPASAPPRVQVMSAAPNIDEVLLVGNSKALAEIATPPPEPEDDDEDVRSPTCLLRERRVSRDDPLAPLDDALLPEHVPEGGAPEPSSTPADAGSSMPPVVSAAVVAPSAGPAEAVVAEALGNPFETPEEVTMDAAREPVLQTTPAAAAAATAESAPEAIPDAVVSAVEVTSPEAAPEDPVSAVPESAPEAVQEAVVPVVVEAAQEVAQEVAVERVPEAAPEQGVEAEPVTPFEAALPVVPEIPGVADIPGPENVPEVVPEVVPEPVEEPSVVSGNPFAAEPGNPFEAEPVNPWAASSAESLSAASENPFLATADTPLDAVSADPFAVVASSSENPFLAGSGTPLEAASENPFLAGSDKLVETASADPFADASENPFAAASDNPFLAGADTPLEAASADPFAAVASSENPFLALSDAPLEAASADPFAGVASSENPFLALSDAPLEAASADPFAGVASSENPFLAGSGAPLEAASADPFAGVASSENPFLAGSGAPLEAASADPFAAVSDNPFAATSGNPFLAVADTPLEAASENPFLSGSDTPLEAESTDPYAAVSDNPFEAASENPFLAGSDNPLVGVSEDPFAAVSDNPFAAASDNPFLAGSDNPFEGDSGNPFVGTSGNQFEADAGNPFASAVADNPFRGATGSGQDAAAASGASAREGLQEISLDG